MLIPAMLDLGSLVFAVVGSEKDMPTSLTRPEVYGTAFCIGPALFVTAAHVVRSVEADGGAVTLVGIKTGASMRAFQAQRTELHEGCDIGLIGCAVDESIPFLDWQMEALPLLADVSAVGFPYAVTANENAYAVAMRGLKGYVITRRSLWRLPARPVGYEVSCPFPKGLSGAPMTVIEGGLPLLRLAGVVVGSGSVEVEGDVTSFGEAVDVQVLANIESEMVGGKLSELRRRSRLTKPSASPDFDQPMLQWPATPRG